MKRNIIEITEHGTITIPSETVWMSEAELVSLFGGYCSYYPCCNQCSI